MSKFYLVSRKNEVLAWVTAQSLEHAVEVMAEKIGTATRRDSDCIMPASDYQPGRNSNHY